MLFKLFKNILFNVLFDWCDRKWLDAISNLNIWSLVAIIPLQNKWSIPVFKFFSKDEDLGIWFDIECKLLEDVIWNISILDHALGKTAFLILAQK